MARQFTEQQRTRANKSETRNTRPKDVHATKPNVTMAETENTVHDDEGRIKQGKGPMAQEY